MADWQAIKTEYITTDTSYRKLAQKHGVGESTIFARASKEKWVEQKEQHKSKAVAKALKAVESKQAERTAKLYGVGGLLLDKVKELLEEHPEVLADTSAMKDVSVVLKNLKDLMSVKSDADMREQEARIEKLRKDAMADEVDKQQTVTVIMGGDADKYAD